MEKKDKFSSNWYPNIIYLICCVSGLLTLSSQYGSFGSVIKNLKPNFGYFVTGFSLAMMLANLRRVKK